ncbi:MAG TPA: Gfo/Idh/MocA family oxidoreductase [Pirellulales bacterium]
MQKVLVVGGGSIGERHLRSFQQTGLAEVALCEADAARRAAVAERYSVRGWATLDEAAAHDWDAAVICTPAHLHVAHALKLAPRTTALLIEKPLATRIDEALELRQALTGKIVRVAYTFRMHPAVRAVADLVRQGELGRVLQVTVVGGQHFPTYRPAYREIYYAQRATGGGAVQDAVTHALDLIQHLAGRFDWIFCDYGHQALEGVTVEDTVHVVGRTAGDTVMVSLAESQFMAPNELFVQLNGTTASAQIRLHEQRFGVHRLGGQWQWSEPLVAERDDLFRAQARELLGIGAGQPDELCSLDDALHVLRVNLAALASQGREPIAIQRDD